MLTINPVRSIAVLLSLLMLSGCALPIKSLTEQKKATQQAALNSAPTLSGLGLCQSELQALQGYDPALYQTYSKNMESGREKASQYLVVRPTMSQEVQTLMDSIYQTQMARLCQQIHADLFNSMIKRADTQ